MSLSTSLSRAGRLLRKPPGYLIRRSMREMRMEGERLLAPIAARTVTGPWLVRKARAPNLDALWQRLSKRHFPFAKDGFDAEEFSIRFPKAKLAILAAAERAVLREVNLLGTGPTNLGNPIDWLSDIRTGDRWEPAFCRSIDYVNRGRPSDVKIPWEISRLQWLIPAGQAYRLTGDERYAAAARDILDSWIEANPYAWTVNWSCTMEPALRILSWTWLFHQFATSQSWTDEGFRGRFLSSLYLHSRFVETHIERSTINGNHLTADAAGLVFAGHFFGEIGDAPRWAEGGWAELSREIELQVHPDGVDFEASVPYHRLVAELFVLPARYRQVFDLTISKTYIDRLLAMAKFTAAYSRPDGSSPAWGDGDDGRAIPLGTQSLTDHRYLVGLIALTIGDKSLNALPWGAGDEIAWHFGLKALNEKLPDIPVRSTAFSKGGVYIFRDGRSHVFIDCGPVGLGGHGGHGHNDALSFEAWFDGVPLVIDPGSYVYTSSFEDRNAFRCTAAHNTLQVDGEEINRFHSMDDLWSLHDDARATCLAFTASPEMDEFVGIHHGFERLDAPVTVRRTIRLDHASGTLTVHDEAAGSGRHRFSMPIYLAPGVLVGEFKVQETTLTVGSKKFRLEWSGSHSWECSVEETRISTSYGVVVPSKRLNWRVNATSPTSLTILLAQCSTAGD